MSALHVLLYSLMSFLYSFLASTLPFISPSLFPHTFSTFLLSLYSLISFLLSFLALCLPYEIHVALFLDLVPLFFLSFKSTFYFSLTFSCNPPALTLFLDLLPFLALCHNNSVSLTLSPIPPLTCVFSLYL